MCQTFGQKYFHHNLLKLNLPTAYVLHLALIQLHDSSFIIINKAEFTKVEAADTLVFNDKLLMLSIPKKVN